MLRNHIDNHPVTQGIGPSSPERDRVFDEACLGKFPLPRSYSEFVQQLNPPNDGRPFSIMVCLAGHAYFKANTAEQYTSLRDYFGEIESGFWDGVRYGFHNVFRSPTLYRCAVIVGDYPESPQEPSQLEG